MGNSTNVNNVDRRLQKSLLKNSTITSTSKRFTAIHDGDHIPLAEPISPSLDHKAKTLPFSDPPIPIQPLPISAVTTRPPPPPTATVTLPPDQARPPNSLATYPNSVLNRVRDRCSNTTAIPYRPLTLYPPFILTNSQML